jgi:sec-independent protein translocase protein TatA
MGGFGWPEILIILVIVVLIFGVGKFADVGPAVGKAIRGFREAVSDDEIKSDEAVAAEEANDIPAEEDESA